MTTYSLGEPEPTTPITPATTPADSSAPATSSAQPAATGSAPPPATPTQQVSLGPSPTDCRKCTLRASPKNPSIRKANVMLPAPEGWYAEFASDPNGRVDFTEELVGWDDQGRPLIADTTTGQLVVASEQPGFAGVTPHRDDRYCGFIPATECWAAEVPVDVKSGRHALLPVIGFWIDAMGGIGPVVVNTLGEAYLSTARIRIMLEEERDQFLYEYRSAANAARERRSQRLRQPRDGQANQASGESNA